ncbi:helix-turn-helix domain-containing protein [Nocardia testacea]|uniref:Helix-turn-helix domain-containing protein n=1 Tax=Nocardia testacea TaxID=248551 RepID=A0ABW7VPJ0_9NOCA
MKGPLRHLGAAYTGRAPALTADQIGRLRARAEAGESKSVLAAEFGITRQTVYNYLRAEATQGLL